MLCDRRGFIRTFGATLGSLIVSGALSGCGSPENKETATVKSAATNQGEPLPKPRAPQWNQLRQCWLDLRERSAQYNTKELFEAAVKQNKDPFTVTTEAVAKEHRAILDALVAAGELREPVAKDMQVAYGEAVYHVARSSATCYMGQPFEYEPRKDLLQQQDTLSRISGDLNPETVAKAQAAITQDIACFEVINYRTLTEMLDHRTGDYASVAKGYKTGSLKVSPEALEAARLLAQLFVERPD